jgi:hypothetical protein
MFWASAGHLGLGRHQVGLFVQGLQGFPGLVQRQVRRRHFRLQGLDVTCSARIWPASTMSPGWT